MGKERYRDSSEIMLTMRLDQSFAGPRTIPALLTLQVASTGTAACVFTISVEEQYERTVAIDLTWNGRHHRKQALFRCRTFAVPLALVRCDIP